MQLLRGTGREVDFVLDGAHNPHAVQALAETLAQVFPGRRLPCVFAVLADKDADDMVRLLAPHVSHWFCTRTNHPRMRPPEEVAALCRSFGGEASILSLDQDAAAVLRELRSPLTPVLVAGSLYLVGHVVTALRDKYEELRPLRDLEPFVNEHR